MVSLYSKRKTMMIKNRGDRMCVCSKLPKIRVLIGISRTEVTKDVFAKWAFNKSLRLIPPCTSTSDPTPKDLLWALLL